MTTALLSLVLFILTIAIYFQAYFHPFISFDDPDYIINNSHITSGLSIKNVLWAMTSVESYNWHPLTWLSHMTDVQLFGVNPHGHHLTSIFIHSLTTLCLFYLLVSLTCATWQSFFVAALFSLHPLHVESVAWLAERKDVLSGLFWFITLICYSRYVQKRNWQRYCLALGSFTLGLMAKPMLVTLPVVLLFLDLWPLNRYERTDLLPYSLRRTITTLVIEKVPFFILSLLSAAITIYAQHSGGAVATFAMVPLPFRIKNSLLAYVTYLEKTFWPQDLAMLYPFPADISPVQFLGSLATLLCCTYIALRLLRRRPYVLVGWSWFLITLLPVIGIIQVGSQALADRYMYIPATGLFIIAAWGCYDLIATFRLRRTLLILLTGAALTSTAAVTWQQLHYWQDSITLYRHTLRVTAGSATIHHMLGCALTEKGQAGEAIEEFRKALRIDATQPDIHAALGDAYFKRGDSQAAVSEYQEAIRLDQNYAAAHYNLGRIFKEIGNFSGAVREYQETLRIHPAHAKAHNSLGIIYSSTGRISEAIEEYRAALRLKPDNAEAHYNLGLDLLSSGNLDEAVKELQKAVQLNKSHAQAQLHLQQALIQQTSRETLKQP